MKPARRHLRVIASAIDFSLLSALGIALGAVENKYDLSSSENALTRHLTPDAMVIAQSVLDIKRLRGTSPGCRRAGIKVIDVASENSVGLVRASAAVGVKRAPAYISSLLMADETRLIRQRSKSIRDNLKAQRHQHRENVEMKPLILRLGSEVALAVGKSILLTLALKKASTPLREHLKPQTIIVRVQNDN
jgi:hypothetical protein